MANTITYGVNGKFGRLTLLGSGPGQDLRLTKFGLHFKSDKIDMTNTRSPAVVLGVTNVTTQILSEWLASVLDVDLSFEGVFTILDNATGPVYNHLLSMTSGTPGMIPGTSSADAYGHASFSLYPDTAHYPAEIITGNCVIETFEIDGEVRGELTFKGTAAISGTLAMTSNL